MTARLRATGLILCLCAPQVALADPVFPGAEPADAPMAEAQTPPAQGNFTFKRLKVSGIKPGKRITVQIDPVEQAALLAAAPKVDPRPDYQDQTPPLAEPLAPQVATTAHYDWFWTTVPTAISANDDRFFLAMAALSQGPDGTAVRAPRLQAMQGLAEAYGAEIMTRTVGTDVSPALVLAVMAVESAGKVNAESHAGAQGLMQLIPATAARFGVSDAMDAAQNIKGGVAYLDWLMGNFDRDPLMVIAAYNAGEGAVSANQGVPPYAETRDYVPKVLAAWQVAQGLCLSPPMLMSDPCVFKVLSAAKATEAVVAEEIP
ncbi:lytic transglycosylase domain-containing protein [Rhodobacter sp. KR11]|uniref:lytic transglycosylase domain-containing protein n=1 Tax=Rhodobacter sp. KR11 TaxID=2974588 RepID=UPI002221EF84|nr:lytic transglycosylase domain-containing protein [Rhodobacter sp. KR11]MCW1917388.1 lytic transglycosylase domain-containing protein [Rhodobacter sp. KR11]